MENFYLIWYFVLFCNRDLQRLLLWKWYFNYGTELHSNARVSGYKTFQLVINPVINVLFNVKLIIGFDFTPYLVGPINN